MSAARRRFVVVGLAVLAAVFLFWVWTSQRRGPYAPPRRDAAFWRRRASSPESRIKAQAFRQLARRNDREGIEAITTALRSDESGFVRAVAAECLGTVKSKQHVPLLKSALNDKDMRVSDAAVQALGKVAGKEAFDALVGAIDEKDEHKTVMVTVALPSFQTNESEDVLIKLLDTRSAWIRWRTIRSLIKVGTQRCVPRLKQLEGNPLGGTDYEPPQFKKHEISEITSRMLAEAIEAASKRPAWSQRRDMGAKGGGG